MNKATAAIVVALCLTAQASCAADEGCGDLDTLGWLTGVWETTSETSRFVESWRRVSETTFEGNGVAYDAATGDLRSQESLLLVAMGGQVFYIAKIADNPYPVPFLLNECSDDSAVFVNPDHDFPRRLHYRYDGRDTLRVNVSDGEDKNYELVLARKGKDGAADN